MVADAKIRDAKIPYNSGLIKIPYFGWVTASATRTSERRVEDYYSEIGDYRQTLLSGQLYRHRFSAISLCPRANAIQHTRESLRSHTQREISTLVNVNIQKNMFYIGNGVMTIQDLAENCRIIWSKRKIFYPGGISVQGYFGWTIRDIMFGGDFSGDNMCIDILSERLYPRTNREGKSKNSHTDGNTNNIYTLLLMIK